MKKIQIISHVVNIAFILIKDYINPRKQKGYSLYYYDGVCFIELALKFC